MASTVTSHRKAPRAPAGCEDHLTRQQAAQLLGFASEFKIRQLEREGRLRSVRGPMRTAFYARADVLALKAELGNALPEEGSGAWTDAELLLLLAHPNREGRVRGTLDLVLEARISIDRAERVHGFWKACQAAMGRAATTVHQERSPEQGNAEDLRPNRVGVTAASGQVTGSLETASKAELAVDAEAAPPEVTSTPPAHRPPATPHEALTGTRVPRESASGKAPLDERTLAAVEVDVDVDDERRSEERLSRDLLIQELRDPDPRVRARAFARLKQAGH